MGRLFVLAREGLRLGRRRGRLSWLGRDYYDGTKEECAIEGEICEREL
jgi:hypothetical protein